MESIDRLLIPLLLVVAVTAIITCLVIYNRKRRQHNQPVMAKGAQPTAVEETKPTVIGEAQSTAAEKPQLIVVEEPEPTAAEETQPALVEEAQAGAVLEAQPIVLWESQPTVGAETKPAAVEEAQPIEKESQPTLAGETQLTIGQEVRPIASEETKPTIEETQPQAQEKVSQKAGRGRREPQERGGRPRVPAKSPEERPKREIRPHRPKPEIVCLKRGRQWIVGIEVPEDLLSYPGLEVRQNDRPLTQDESREGCWRLERASGEVVVRWNEVEVKEISVVLGEELYLMFKLSGQNQNQGRRVNPPSSGWYLVVVPDNWERDDALSGPQPVAPESVSLTGYQAHFFILERDGDGKIAFRTPAKESVVIESKAPQFELVGTRLNDIEDMGSLFGERPPRIRALQEQAWKGVGTIVVGEEGTGKGKWRLAFSPVQDLIEQDLPAEVAARKSGWYFLRFYNTNNDLIESLDFRFISALRDIKISQPPPLPLEGEHKPVCVEFLHEPGCTVQPADDLTNIRIERRDDKTIMTIPPDPAYDETHWLVSPEGAPQVKVTIAVERVWWALGEENKELAEWKDQLIALSRDDFAATSERALWLRLPRRRWVDKVLVGFEQPKARPYDVKVTEETIAVPLREFGDSEEVADSTKEFHLKVWIKRDGSSTDGVVAVVPASERMVAPVPVQVVSPPTPHWIGLGRKKTAVAEAVLQNGSGEIKVNGQPIEHYFRGAPIKARQFLQRLLELDQVRGALSQMEVRITVTGSGPTKTRQAKAAAHALARALMSYDAKLKPLLKQAGFGGVRVTKAPTMEREG